MAADRFVRRRSTTLSSSSHSQRGNVIDDRTIVASSESSPVVLESAGIITPTVGFLERILSLRRRTCQYPR